MAAHLPPLYVIVGPTGVGKTAVAVQLAQRLGTQVVSADSRQVYQGMAIGTAQPTPAELAAVPHHLVGHLPVTQVYNAGHYEREALPIIEQLLQSYGSAVLVGGSGLYVQAVCLGLAAMPPVPAPVRLVVQQRLAQAGLPALLAELARLDPAYYAQVDQANPVRITRALEVIEATGRPFSQWRQSPQVARPFRPVVVGLNLPRPELYARIDARAQQMWAAGLVAEVTALRPYRHHQALQTVGYPEVFDYLDGNTTQAQALALMQQHTRNYAKRQLTWFSKMEGIQWHHPGQPRAIWPALGL
jgi:tRNA dimethylallyltransferase